ncbi:LigT-like protein [Rickenella mellea]|uniref:LigT-like protein n=1 Tax=Rickenella mellea TaxID=50990 RepID=A0A4Y7QC57_9AGAM|nr:LigT-like protein [Rickenella mellea]
MGVALWIVPSATEAAELRKFMDQPPLETEISPYPSFPPHITLGSFPSETPLSEITSAITSLADPLRIKFKSIDVGDHFFRSVFISIENTTKLRELHGAIHDALKLERKTPNFPHLSLYYIAESKASERQLVLDNLWKKGRLVRLSEGEVALNLDHSGGQERLISEFAAKEAVIALCDGPVEEWKILDTITLCL